MEHLQISEKIMPHHGRCAFLTNGVIEMAVTLDYGPRIICYAFVGDENMLCEVTEYKEPNGWRAYGGHRIWHGPESYPRTYEPDNTPLQWELIENGIRLIQATESKSNVQKELEIVLQEGSARVQVRHRIYNRGMWAVDLAVWAVTMMQPGGLEIIPMISHDTGLIPNANIVLWPGTNVNDPRIRWGEKFVYIQHNKGENMKIGFSNESGFAAYYIKELLFVKQYKHLINGHYVDRGSSYQTFVGHQMLEMESLSPLIRVEPSGFAEHGEEWNIVRTLRNQVEVEENVLEIFRKNNAVEY